MSDPVFLAPGLLQDLKSKYSISSDAELAKLLGCERSTLHRMETHEIPLSLEVSTRLVLRFHIPYTESMVLEPSRSERGLRDVG